MLYSLLSVQTKVDRNFVIGKFSMITKRILTYGRYSALYYVIYKLLIWWLLYYFSENYGYSEAAVQRRSYCCFWIFTFSSNLIYNVCLVRIANVGLRGKCQNGTKILCYCDKRFWEFSLRSTEIVSSKIRQSKRRHTFNK